MRSLLNKKLRAVTGASVFFACANVFAVTYELPSPGYYQLQDKNTFQTVCETSGGACDVPAGTYTLLNFNVSPAERTDVTIGSSTGGGDLISASFARVDNRCTFFGAGGNTGSAFQSGNFASCSALCPTTSPRVYSVLTCTATVLSSRNLTNNLAASASTQVNDGEGGRDTALCLTDEADQYLAPPAASDINGMSISIMCGPR